MWTKFDQVELVRKRGPADPEAARRAVIALRFELLHAAVSYGLHCLEADGRDRSSWREWLRWVAVQAAMRSERDDRVRHGVEPVDWIQQAIDQLDHPPVSASKDPFDDPDRQRWARECFEDLALRARPIERANGEPLAEIQRHKKRAGMRLFAAVQDSLILASSADPATRDARAGAAEILEYLIAARDDGIWKVLVAR